MTYKQYRSLVFEDLKRFVPDIERYGMFKRLMLLYKTRLRFETFSILYWFRTMQYYGNKRGVFYKLLCLNAKIRSFYLRRQTGIQIPMSVTLGGGLLFCHYSCIVFAYNVVVGKNCSIHQGVTIGRSFAGKKAGVPVIGDNVIIFPGAKVVGNIRIGNNVVIGANATVLNDVPDNCVVAGTPAKIISTDSKKAIGEEWFDFFAWNY